MSASIELVTSHKGTPHITTEQVKDLLAGFSGEITGIKKFALDDEFKTEVVDLLEVQIGTGQGLAGGYHFQLTSAYDWILDTEAVGYSRIDTLYLVIYEDPITNVQTADFVYQKGEPYQNGASGQYPSAPTGTTVKETFAFLNAYITDGAIVTIGELWDSYLSNEYLSLQVKDAVSQLENEFSGAVSQVNENTDALNGFRFGRDSNGNYGYYKAGADTVTPFRNPSGTAQASDVVKGKTFSNSTGDNIEGTMWNRGAVSAYVNPNGQYTVPSGYHNGNGKVYGRANYEMFTFDYGSEYIVDLGADNLVRYVNANRVYEEGENDGKLERSTHNISARIQGEPGRLLITFMQDGVNIETGSATGSFNDTYVDVYGTIALKTSYNGGLST